MAAMPNISFDFTDRSIIATGAARGIGLAIAEHFHSAGAAVFMVDFDERALNESAQSLGATPIAADVSRSADMDTVVSTVMAAAGRVDILINNAGILRDKVCGNSLTTTGTRCSPCMPAVRSA